LYCLNSDIDVKYYLADLLQGVKMQDVKVHDLKLQDLKIVDQIAQQKIWFFTFYSKGSTMTFFIVNIVLIFCYIVLGFKVRRWCR